MHKYRAIIADDEPNLIRYLQDMLARLWPELEVVATAGNGMEALGLIRDEEPDIAFLDIRMPVLTGIQVAKRVQGECRIVFITAYDEYAVEAFESAAIDYLLKPVEEARLVATIERVKKLLEQQISQGTDWQQTIERLALQMGANKPGKYLSWIRAGEGEDTRMIPVDEVRYFKSDDKYTTVATREKEFLIRKAIKELAVELDPDQFWQIHRGCIVQVALIAQVKKVDNGAYKLYLKEGSETLSVSRRYGHLFKQM